MNNYFNNMFRMALVLLCCLPFWAMSQTSQSLGGALDGFFNALKANASTSVGGLEVSTELGNPLEIPQAWLPDNALASGKSHTIYLSPQGIVFGWGSNSEGQIGQGRIDGKGPTGSDVVAWAPGNFSTPKKIELDNVVAVYAAGNQSFALKKDGSVWAWGHGRYLGIGAYNSDAVFPVPMPVNGLPSIAKLQVWDQGVYAFGTDDSVWIWGEGVLSRMLQGREFRRFQTSTPVRSKLGSPQDIRVSSNDSDASYILTKNRKLFHPDTPTPILPVDIERVFGTSGYISGNIFFQSVDQTLYSLETGSPQRMPNGTVSFSVSPLKGLGIPVQIAQESDFSVFLQTDGSMLVWGGAGPLGRGFIPFSQGMPSAKEIPKKVSNAPAFASIKSNLSGIYGVTQGGVVYRHEINSSSNLPLPYKNFVLIFNPQK